MAKIDIFGGAWEETPVEVLKLRAERALEAFAERVARDRDVRQAYREDALGDALGAALGYDKAQYEAELAKIRGDDV